MSVRKIPASKQLLNRLYWLDGMSTIAIGRMFGASERAVRQLMIRLGIPRRKPWRRKQAQCVQCGKPTCQVKRWKRGVVRWYWSNRCAVCHHAHIRKNARDWLARKRGSAKRRGPYRVPLGGSKLIAREGIAMEGRVV